MISGICNSTQFERTGIRPSGAVCGKEFEMLLNESVQASDIMIPEKWITDSGLGSSAVEEVLKYLDNIGEDTKSRKPTHDITDEQIEWLKSRHDIERLRSGEAGYNASGGSAEIRNFYADLVYLNVFSPEDTKTTVTKYPTIPAHIIAWAEFPIESPYTEDFGWLDCNSLVDMALYSIKMQARFLGAIKDKANGP